MTAVLLEEVTETRTETFTVLVEELNRPARTVDEVFEKLGFPIMNEAEFEAHKRKMEAQAYQDAFQMPAPRDLDIATNERTVKQAWKWHRGHYSLGSHRFVRLNDHTHSEMTELADPIMVNMAARLDAELRQVPGVYEVSHHVETFYKDPVAGVVVKQKHMLDRYIRYYAWMGNKTLWPPEAK